MHVQLTTMKMPSYAVPFAGLVFSGSAQHKSLVENMDTAIELNYYSEVSMSRVTFTITLNEPSQVELDPNFASAIDSLPATADSISNMYKWFDFYGKYGTHYVRTILFGGNKRLTTFIHDSIEQDSDIKQSDWGVYFAAKFDGEFSANAGAGKNSNKQMMQEFDSYCESSNKLTIGGDSLIDKWDDWLKTVEVVACPRMYILDNTL
eukprot:COSAG02_NODE_10269_length_1982_cov_1.808816_1_plen_205_part_10